MEAAGKTTIREEMSDSHRRDSLGGDNEHFLLR